MVNSLGAYSIGSWLIVHGSWFGWIGMMFKEIVLVIGQ